MKEIKNIKQGFTLLELLVVVLIIGILASIALPQYQMAVTKAKVASILPIMRRWKDALAEYKLQHGSYDDLEPDEGGAVLSANWPSDWNNGTCGDAMSCDENYWVLCSANETSAGYVYCQHDIDSDNSFLICMYQADDEENESVAGMMTCEAKGTEGEKVCKALGGKFLEDVSEDWGMGVYKLN